MLKQLRHILPFALLCVLWACGGDSALQSALDSADALMESRPDSALTLLKPYDGAQIKSEEQRARFALLYSMALHKNFIDVESDSLISIASGYYDRGREAMISTYYRAYINHNARRFDKAAVLALESFDKAERLKDTLFMAHSLDLLGLIEYESYLMEESLPHFNEAASFYKVTGRTQNQLVALENAALSLDWLGRSQESILLLDSLKQQAWAIQDTAFAVELSSKMIPVLLKNGNPNPTLTDIEVASLAGYSDVYSDDPCALSSLALYRLNKGDFSGCDSLLQCARAAVTQESEKASILSVEVESARKSGNLIMASELTDSMLQLQSAVVRGLFKREITTAERDYIDARRRQAEAEKRGTRIVLWLSLVGFLILGFTAAIVVCRIIRSRNDKIERQIDEIRLLTDNLRRAKSQNSNLTEVLQLPYYKALDSICDQYFLGAESEVDRNLLNKHIDDIMETLRGEESMAEVREFVNRNFDSILDRAKEAIPRLKDSDLTFIALIKLGFTARAVCVLQNMKQPTFYSKRDRLERRLRNCGITL